MHKLFNNYDKFKIPTFVFIILESIKTVVCGLLKPFN